MGDHEHSECDACHDCHQCARDYVRALERQIEYADPHTPKCQENRFRIEELERALRGLVDALERPRGGHGYLNDPLDAAHAALDRLDPNLPPSKAENPSLDER